jgi:hypothetical protein
MFVPTLAKSETPDNQFGAETLDSAVSQSVVAFTMSESDIP